MVLKEILGREFSFFKGNYKILVLSWIVMDLAIEMPTPNFQYYIQALGGTGMAVGIIGLANFFSLALVSFPGGYLADKYGRKWLISTMTFVMGFSYLIFAFSPTWHFILIGTIVNSLSLIYQPALFAMVQDSLPPDNRGLGSAIIQLINGTFNTPGPIVAGYLLIKFGLVMSMRAIYLIMTILFLVAALIRLNLKETVSDAEPIHLGYVFSSYPKAVKESFNVWRIIPKSMFWLFIGQTIWMFCISITQVVNPLYSRDVLLIPEEQWWYVFIPLLLTMVVASVPAGKLIDRTRRKIPLIIALFANGVATMIFLRGDLVNVMISMSLLGFAQLLGMSAVTALSTDLVDINNRGKVNGFINFVSYIAMGLGMLLGNYLYIDFSPQIPFYFSLALMIPILAIILFLIDEPKS